MPVEEQSDRPPANSHPAYDIRPKCNDVARDAISGTYVMEGDSISRGTPLWIVTSSRVG